jgi:hypothetical protein
LRSSPRPPNSQPGGSLPFHCQGDMGTKRSVRQAQQSRLRRNREGANQAQVSHHRRPPALQGYGDSMRGTHVLQAFSSRKGSTAVQIPEDPPAQRPAIPPSAHRPRDGAGAGPGPRLDEYGTHGVIGTQEDAGTWPGEVTAGLGATVLTSVLTSRLLWSRRRAGWGEVKLTGPAAAWRRARTSLMPTAGGRSSAAAKGALLAGMAVRVALGPRPGERWRSGLTSTHSAARRCAGGRHDHVSGTGLLSRQTKRGVAGSCCTAKSRQATRSAAPRGGQELH